MPQIPEKYVIGVNFSKEDYSKWIDQLAWWVGDRMPNVKNPREHAEKVLEAARYGRKLNGETWSKVPQNFFKRVTAMTGFDVFSGTGVRDPRKARALKIKAKDVAGNPVEQTPSIDLNQALELRAQYIKDLLAKYPHLDTPVYKPKVEELAETIVKSRMISTDFIASRGKQLESLSKVRESLHKQIGELMEFLEISPKQRVTKTLEAKNSDVGSLISKLESYGEVWKEYEKLDSLRELLQFYRMLNSTRPDGTPQLNDWELWHLTRNRPVKFKCRCGESYELLGGFTPQEIEQALVQAQELYGFGLEAIDKSLPESSLVIDQTLASEEIFDESPEAKNESDPENSGE